MFGDPRVGGAGRGGASDGMDQGNSVRGQQFLHLGEIFGVMRHTHMFEHANRYDPVKLAGQLAVIYQLKRHPV